MMSKSKMKYVSYVPTIVGSRSQQRSHNSKTVPGTGSFRAWFDTPHHDYVICSCGWAAHIGKHSCEAPMEEET